MAREREDTHSLRCHFIVKTHPKAGEHWCEGQCSVDGVPFLQYSNQGKEVNATKGCADLYPKLKDTGKELRTLLLHMKKEAVLTRDNHNLQGTMVSQYKPGQLIDASWKFTIDGQYAFCLNRYNQKNKKWEVINYNATGILAQWENNAELAQDLAMLSMGDSDLCLKEILKHQKEMPNTPSLRCHFSIKSRPKDGQKEWEVQCTVDGVLFIQDSNTGKAVNDSEICNDWHEKLKDTGEDLRNQLVNMEEEKLLTRDNHNLQGTMVSQYKQGQLIPGPWNFTIDGQYAFCFIRYNLKNKKWEVINCNTAAKEEEFVESDLPTEFVVPEIQLRLSSLYNKLFSHRAISLTLGQGVATGCGVL
ncbi:NKG2D ligand 1-like protein [Cricetulus griseus]|nr:NKG2D ligand 1-like protein [Cricetulus griseus]